MADMFCRFGVPDGLHSDQGRNFESKVFAEVCERMGVKKTRMTLLHPKSDGQVERFNRTLATQLAIVTSQHQRDWDCHLPHVLWVYRSAALMFGRELRMPVDLAFGMPPDPELPTVPGFEYLRDLQQRLAGAHDFARQNQTKAGARQKRAYGNCCRGHTFLPGERVWVFCPDRKKGISPKLTSKWFGPCKVLEQLSDVVYRLGLQTRGRIVVLHRD